MAEKPKAERQCPSKGWQWWCGMCTLAPGCKLPRKNKKAALGGSEKFPSNIKVNAENSIYSIYWCEYCSCVVQNILVVPEVICVNRAWCLCGSKRGGGRCQLAFLQIVWGVVLC